MSTGVYESMLRAELQAAHEAIRAIVAANLAVLQGVAGGEDLDDAIAVAERLLPTELRAKGQAPLNTRRRSTSLPYEDLLG